MTQRIIKVAILAMIVLPLAGRIAFQSGSPSPAGHCEYEETGPSVALTHAYAARVVKVTCDGEAPDAAWVVMCPTAKTGCRYSRETVAIFTQDKGAEDIPVHLALDGDKLLVRYAGAEPAEKKPYLHHIEVAYDRQAD